MTKRLVAQLEANLGKEIAAKLKAAVAATSGFGWPLYGGVALGMTLALVASGIVDQYGSPLWYAIGGSVGVVLGLTLQNRTATGNGSPGDLFVILGTTRAELIIFQRSLWNSRPEGIAGRVTFSEIAGISGTKRLLGNQVIVVTHRDGTAWRYEVPGRQWVELRERLPPAVATPAP